MVDMAGFSQGREISNDGVRELPWDMDSITSYNVIEAENMDEAEKIAKGSQYYYQGVFKIGVPEVIVSHLGELIDAGVEYFQIAFPQGHNIEATQLFADEVIPELS